MLDLKVNRELLPMKGYYFFYNAAAAPVISFMSIYANQLGFSSFVVGIVYTILPFSGMLAKPLMGMISDKYKCQKLIFLSGQIVMTITFIFIIFLPSVPVENKIDFACGHDDAVIKVCDKTGKLVSGLDDFQYKENNISCNMTCPIKNNGTEYSDLVATVPMNLIIALSDTCVDFRVTKLTYPDGKTTDPLCHGINRISAQCVMHCDSKTLNNYIREAQGTDIKFYNYYQFWLMLVVYLLCWVSQAFSVSNGDTICFQLLGSQPYKYGYQRMYGSLGWGLSSIVAGFVIDSFSTGSDNKNYTPVFCIGIAIMIICIAVSYQIKYTQQYITTNIIGDLGRVLLNLPVFVFVLWCLCMGLCTALIWNFLFWLLEHLAKKQGPETVSWIKTIEGLVMGIQCLGGELPLFFLSSRILKYLKHINVMSLILLAMGIRFILYSLITNPWHCLPIELMNGITFGLFYATMTSYASIIAPPGTEATTQGLVGAIFEGIGVSLGSFIAGLLYDLFDDKGILFRIYGIFALIASLLHAGVQFLISRNKDRSKGSWVQYATPQDAMDMIDKN